MATQDLVEQKRIVKTISVPAHRWDIVKEAIMQRIDYEKYTQNPELGRILIESGVALLVEDVPDEFWGKGIAGSGLNKAGRILMHIRHCIPRGQTPFPSILIVSDSMLKHVQGAVLPIPGADIEFVTTVAQTLAGEGTKVVLVFVGTNDVFKKDGVIVSPKLKAETLWKWGIEYAKGHQGQAIVVSTILYRNGPQKVISKVEKFRETLLKCREEGGSPGNVFIFDCMPFFRVQDLSDGLHLSQEGSARLSHMLTSAGEALLNGSREQIPYLL